MVLVIAFLTIINIALGYGLAIYVNRHFGTLLLSRSKSPAAAQQKIAHPPAVEQLDGELPTLAPTAVSVIAEQAATKPAAGEQVDEENVLAGIEEFRSQLAKMNTAVDQSPVEVSAPEVELAAAN